MRRRTVLGLVGSSLTAGLAGCGRSKAQNVENVGVEAPPHVDAVDLVAHELRRSDEETFVERVQVVGKAKNTARIELTGVQLRVQFFDADGTELEEVITDERPIGGTREWLFEVAFDGIGPKAREVADYQIEVVDQSVVGEDSAA